METQHKAMPPIADLLDLALALITRSAKTADQRADVRSGRIPVAKGWIISRVLRDEIEGGCGLRLKDLVEHTGLSASTVSETVAQLVVGGALRRERDPKDGRAIRISLTDRGRKSCAANDAVLGRLWEEAVEGLPRRDVAAFWRVAGAASGRLRDVIVEADRGGADDPDR